MPIDVDSLVQPLGEQSPCGDDLAETPEFAQLAAGFRKHLAEELMIEGELKDDPPPSFENLLETTLDLLGRSRDLRLGAYALWSCIQTDRLAGLREGLRLLRGLIDGLWSSGLYPLCEDASDPWERTNVIGELNAKAGKRGLFPVQDALRRVPMIESRQHGRWSLRQILLARGELNPSEGEQVPELSKINQTMGEQTPEDLQAWADLLGESIELTREIESGVSSGSAGSGSVALGDLRAQIEAMQGVISGELASRGYGTDEADAQAAVPGQGGAGAISGEVANRDQVRLAMDKILRYYEGNEPGSPVPMFVRAAQKLVTMSFFDIMAKVDQSTMARLKEIGDGD